MQRYKDYKPTQFDTQGLNADEHDVGDFFVLPCGRNRDSNELDESNYHAALGRLGGESDTVQVANFGHWACGWFELILVHPSREADAQAICDALDGYPVLDENDFSEREHAAAQEVWANCYSQSERIAYMRRYRSQFEFSSFADMLGCARGKYFAGYDSELLAR